MINSQYTDACVVLADENLSSKHSRFEAFYFKCFSKCFSRRSCIFFRLFNIYSKLIVKSGRS